MTRARKGPRFAWALTGSGHFLEECIEIALSLDAVDFFLSRAVEEVLQMYGYSKRLRDAGVRSFHDKTASAVPVGEFYNGAYHTLVLAPATSNTVAKCVAGISDSLVTNVFAQAGKCRLPIIAFPCDTAPVVVTLAPGKTVTVYPRRVDLECAERLAEFEETQVVTEMDALAAAVEARMRWVNESSS